MKPLILHIGLHKTATTTMQSFLQERMPTLAARGVQYLPLEHMRKHLTPLIVRAPLEQQAWERLSAELTAPPDAALLLSDENISGSAREVLNNELYRHSEARVRAIIAAASPRPVELFLTIRDPAEFLVSLYCEYLRHNPFVSFEEYTCATNIHGFSFERMFKWIRALPEHVKAHVLPFETEFGGGLERVTATILSAACSGISRIDLADLPRSRSRSAFTVQEIKLFESIAANAGPLVVKDFINMAERRGHRFGTDRFQPISERICHELAARYRHDLACLTETEVTSYTSPNFLSPNVNNLL